MTGVLCFLFVAGTAITAARSAQAEPAVELARLVDAATPVARLAIARELAKRGDVKLEAWLAAARSFGTFADEPTGERRERLELHVGDAIEATDLWLYVPPGYGPTKAAPLMFMGHGTGSSGEGLTRMWRSVADDLGMLVLAPTEAGSNEGHAFSARERLAALAAVRWMRRRFHLDENRIFGAGISRGGHLVWDLALRHPDVFAAIAPMIGGPRINPAQGQNDPLGALLAYVLFKIAVATGGVGEDDIFTMVLTLAGAGLASTALGVVVGLLLDKLLDHELIHAHLKSPVMLASVLLVFTGAEWIGEENGLLAVTAMGLVLANVQNPHVEEIRHFKEQISTLLIGFLFLVLSARLEPTSLGALLGSPLLVVAAVLFVIRPIVVFVATVRSAIPWSERLLVGWIGPRGVVAAAVAGAFAPRLKEAGYADADLLVPLIFGVIISTVVLHSLSLRPLARWLGLSAGDRGAVLLVGASTMVIELARTLARAGAEVVVTDARFHKVSRARREGVEVHHGDVLSEEMAFELPLERLALMVAASDDDSYNSLVCMRFHAYLPRSRVVQITPPNDGAGRKHADSRTKGEMPWGERATYRDMTGLFWRGYTFKVTQLTEAFGIDALRERNPDSIPLFAVVDGKVETIGVGEKVAVGAKVVHFASPDA